MCYSMLPQQNWWLWNIVEVILRLLVAVVALGSAPMCPMMSDDGKPSSAFLAIYMTLLFLVLGISAIVRSTRLAGLCFSLVVSFFLVGAVVGNMGRAAFIIVLVIVHVVLVDYWLGPFAIFHPTAMAAMHGENDRYGHQQIHLGNFAHHAHTPIRTHDDEDEIPNFHTAENDTKTSSPPYEPPATSPPSNVENA